MDIAITLIKQVLIMFLLTLVGVISYHRKWIDNEGSRQLSGFLLQFVAPVIMIVSYQIPFTMEKLIGLSIAIGLSFVSFGITIAVAQLAFPKQTVAIFGIVFSNSTFFSIPIVMALLGNEAVFYLSAYIVMFSIMSWTYGVLLMDKNKAQLSWKKALLNPGVIGVALGFIGFLSPIKLPSLLLQTMQSITSLNTPLAMIVFGIFLAQTKLTSLFTSPTAWRVSIFRLLLIPVLVTVSFILVPAKYDIVKLPILLAGSAPVGIITVLFSKTFERDHMFATKIVGLSTLLSIVSIPLIVLLAQWLW